MAKVEIKNSSFIVVFIPQNSELFPFWIVESVESTNNSSAALEQAVARATCVMHRVMEERAEQERWRREMNRREREIRTERENERMRREARELVEANGWPQQQRAVTGPGCTSLHEMVSRSCFLFPPLISHRACCQTVVVRQH